MARRLRLTIESEMVQVAALGDAAKAVCATFGLPPGAASDVELSLVEAVNNCIEHAYQFQAGGTIEVLLTSGDPGVHLEVCDRGRSMPANVLRNAKPPEFDPEDITSLPEGGMGLGILKTLMDDVRYETTDGVNVLRMSRCRPDDAVADKT